MAFTTSNINEEIEIAFMGHPDYKRRQAAQHRVCDAVAAGVNSFLEKKSLLYKIGVIHQLCSGEIHRIKNPDRRRVFVSTGDGGATGCESKTSTEYPAVVYPAEFDVREQWTVSDLNLARDVTKPALEVIVDSIASSMQYQQEYVLRVIEQKCGKPITEAHLVTFGLRVEPHGKWIDMHETGRAIQGVSVSSILGCVVLL